LANVVHTPYTLQYLEHNPKFASTLESDYFFKVKKRISYGTVIEIYSGEYLSFRPDAYPHCLILHE